MTVLFGAVQSGFGGAEPPRLPEMLPVRDARGPVEEGAFQTASRPLVSRWPHFHEGLLLLLFSGPGTSFLFYEPPEAGVCRFLRRASPLYFRRRAQQLAALQ